MKTELDWVGDCHDNPMFAAEHITKLEAENKRLRDALKLCQLAVENTNWGWDGDCGLGNQIDYIVESELEGE